MKKIITKSIGGSTLVEVLVSMILIGILMISGTTFFITAWRLDKEQQEYITVINNIANTIEVGINNEDIKTSGEAVALNNNSARNYRDSFGGVYYAYKDVVNANCIRFAPSLGIYANYLICTLTKDGSTQLKKYFVLKTAYYRKWHKMSS
jgi:type II secretory pathway pseudopilin PulG